MISKELILLDKEYKNQNEVVYSLASIAEKRNLLSDIDEYIAAVKEREKEFSTAIGYEVAIPHGKSNVVEEAFIGFCRMNRPFFWNKKDKQKSKLIFLIGVPADKKNSLHLKILAEISKKLMDDSFRQRLSEGNIEQVFENLLSIEKKVILKNEEER